MARLHAESWRDAYRNVLSPDFLADDVERDRRDVWEQRRGHIAAGRHFGVVAQGCIEAGAESRCCGFAYVIPDDTWGWCLDNLHVHPQARGGGVGLVLLQHVARELLRREPNPNLCLWVYAANDGAQRFYARHGASRRVTTMQPTRDGGETLSHCYAWDDVRGILTPLP